MDNPWALHTTTHSAFKYEKIDTKIPILSPKKELATLYILNVNEKMRPVYSET